MHVFFIGLLLCAAPASAEPYGKVSTWIANMEAASSENLGGSIALGYDTGTFRFEAELSNHMHLGNATIAAMLQGCADIGDWRVEPYFCLGAGSTIEDRKFDSLAIQGTAGLAFPVNDSAKFTTGIVQRCYGRLADFCDSRDTAVIAGLRASF